MRKNCLAQPPLSKYFEPLKISHVAVHKKHSRQMTGVYEVLQSRRGQQQ
jgi:hypothetical protein